MSGCQDLGKTDHILIFFTQNAKNINMSDISDHGSADLDMIEVPAGKQSADMHIGSYLGYLAGKNGKNCSVVIVSKDTDFDKVINFWKQKTGIAASRTEQIKKKNVQKQKQTKQPTQKDKQTKQTTQKQNKQPASGTSKTTVKESGKKKTELNREVIQKLRSEGYDAPVANKIAQIVVSMYGKEKMLSNVKNALKKQYTYYSVLYSELEPVLSKYASGDQPKKSTGSKKSQKKTELNSEVQKILSKAGFSNDIINHVASVVVKNYGAENGKQQTYRAIIAKYGQQKGLKIYEHIKKHI